VEYTAEGNGPHEGCDTPPCNWAGVYWQDPASNWGDRPGGYDLTGARALTFWARGQEGGEKISFKIGGIGCDSAPYPDSLCPVRVIDVPDLLNTWQLYTVPLSAGTELSGLVGGFMWAASKHDNPNGATFYLDDIQYHFNMDIALVPFFSPPIPVGPGGVRTFALAFGDADNDGDLDLAIGNHGQNQICWNNGDSTYDCENAFGGSGTFSLVWGRMDNNNRDPDLVVGNFFGNSNRVFLNNGDGTFEWVDFSWCSGGYTSCYVALGDVDGDDDLDIALGNQKGPDLIYVNDGDGKSFSTIDTCHDGATRDLAFGDVDGDGDLDLVAVGHSQDYVCINDGTGSFTEIRPIDVHVGKDSLSVALGDADGDGYLDVAVGGDGGHQNGVYLNDRKGYFPEKILFGPVWDKTWDLSWADVDGDGDLDLASGNEYQQTVVYINESITASPGFTLTELILPAIGSYRTRSVAFGDVDNDCDLDLAAGQDGGQNVIYLNTLLGGCVHLPIIMKNTRSHSPTMRGEDG